MTIHDFDMARYLVDSPVIEVYAVGGVLVDEKIGSEAGDIDTAVITLRYANGDMARMSRARCACGRGLPLLASVEGRVLDAIRTPAGHLLPGVFFPHMLKDVPGLERFQLVQKRLDRLELSIVRGPAFDDASLAYIRREVHKVLGDSIELNCQFLDDIPLTPSGKRRVTVSELQP